MPSSSHAARRGAGIKLTVTARQLGRHFDQAVEALGLSRAKFGVIAIVSRYPGATQRTIAELLEVTEVTAGRLIERLCADGYLERRPDPGDRRAHRIHLTEKTTPLLDRLGTMAGEHEAAVFAGLEDEEVAKLVDLLDRIAGNLVALKADAASATPSAPKAGKSRSVSLEKITGG